MLFRDSADVQTDTAFFILDMILGKTDGGMDTQTDKTVPILSIIFHLCMQRLYKTHIPTHVQNNYLSKVKTGKVDYERVPNFNHTNDIFYQKDILMGKLT